MLAKPWLTWLVCAASVVVFVGLSAQSESSSWAAYSAWGAPPPNEIWSAKYWALITSVFVHVAWWHVAFNVYWLWILGRAFERSVGHPLWLAFFVSAAVVSSGIELAFSGTQGVGLSGVVYAIFGLLWVLRREVPPFAAVLTRRVIELFLGWLVLCVLLTLFKVWQVGNAAHISGLAFGLSVGFARRGGRSRVLARTGVAVLAVLAIVPLSWSPWSGAWVAYRGYAAHQRADYRRAIEDYQRALSLGFDRAWLLQNLALAYASNGDSTRYVSTLEELRRLDRAAAENVERRLTQAPAN